MRDEKTKQAFIDFLKDPKNKDLRFWQAIRNFSKYNFIFGAMTIELGGIEDTFYIEADKDC